MSTPRLIRRGRDHALGLLRLGSVAAAVSLVVCVARWPGGSYRAGAPRANLATFLGRAHGLRVEAADVAPVELPAGPLAALRPRPVFFLARDGALPRDAYVCDVTFSPAGVPLAASKPANLTRTAAADESRVAARGRRAAFLAVDQGHAVVTIVDAAGESAAATVGFDRQQRWQNALTNFQETGHLRGVDKRVLEIDVKAAPTLEWTGPDSLAVGADRVYDARRGALVRGKGELQLHRKSRRQLVHWAVDTARAVSFIGPRGIAWMEDTFFELVDKLRRLAGITGKARDELLFDSTPDPDEPKVAGWPPAPFAPIFKKPEKGEGEWTLMHDPFIGRNPDAPAPFAQAFVRPDLKRPYAKVFFVAWDPQQVSLNMVGGTRDPRSQTGQVGDGIVPRDDATIKRLVGGFNGGWQTIHGQFGMMSDDKLIARPLPFCATAARLKDGTFGIGSWPNDDSVHHIPPELQSFRQNLFPIAQDGKFDPYGRHSWGGGPGFITGVGPTTHIIRSGLCITKKDRYPMYAWGTSLTGETLAKAMIAAGCEYAMELDINAGHAGFEFYRVMPMPAGGLKKMKDFEGVKLEKNWAKVGAVPGRPDLMYAMRRLSRHMGIQPFPRYIGRDWRDFMYLTLRPVLPGATVAPPIKPPLPDEGHFVSAPYFQGPKPYPPTVATSALRPDAARPGSGVELMRVDLRRVDLSLIVGTNEPPSSTGVDLRSRTGGPNAAPRVAIIPLGVTDPAAPRGLVVGTKRHFPPRRGVDTLAILAPLTPEGPPRVSVGAWGPAVHGEPGTLVVAQGTPPGRLAVAARDPAAAEAGARTPASVAALEGVTLPGATPRRVAGLGVDADGFLVYAVSKTGDAPAVRAALTLAGCRRTALFGGVGLPWLRDVRGGWRALGTTAPQRLLPQLGETRLVLHANPRWGAVRIFTQQAPERREVWMKLLGAHGKSNRLVHGPAVPPTPHRRQHRRGATPR